uniref:Uncharacterized protein n=1 Tax=Oryza barthii TaxID=65489 RepID=A0A0D3GLX7_9ORYZ
MPFSFGSTVSGSDPRCQCWRTQSTSIFRPWCALLLIGHRPQVTSRRNVPKANTSVRGDAFPVRASSGAMNPMVPTRSLYENRCGPNSTSQSSLNSAYLCCLLTSIMTTTKINATATIGNRICKIFCNLLSPGQGSLGNLEISIGGAGAFIAKLHPSTFGHFDGSQSDIDLCGLSIVVHPHLDRLAVAAREGQVLQEPTMLVIVEADVLGFLGVEAVDVDADVPSISSNSVFWAVSISTANMWLLVLLSLLMLRRPKNCAAVALGKPLFGATTKAMPSVLASEYGEMMPNTKATEKDWTMPFDCFLNRSGVG